MKLKHYKRCNDFMTNLLAGSPVGIDVKNYAKSHNGPHHGRYGSSFDPDRRRSEVNGYETWNRTALGPYIIGLASRLPLYMTDFYKTVGSTDRSTLIRFAIFHITVFMFPISTLFGVTSAAAIWIVYWLIPMMGPLQVIRLIAESNEHVYEQGNSEFATTVTNIGWLHRWLFHPYYDGYHLIHHMFPTIPQFLHKKVHAILCNVDKDYRSRHLIRDRVVGEPRKVSLD